MSFCKDCKKRLTLDETALYRRLIYRDSEEDDCLCVGCLAKKLGVGEAELYGKIKYFKEIGCTLFSKDSE